MTTQKPKADRREMTKENSYKKDVAQQIKKAREELDVSVEQAAKMMRWSRSKWIQIEKGQVGISSWEIMKLGCMFEIPLTYFFSDNEVPGYRNDLLEERRKGFGRSIRQVRFRLQKSLAQMADLVQCSAAKWLRIEQGKTDFSAYELELLADWFGVSPDFFFLPDNDWLDHIRFPEGDVGQK